MLLDILHHHGQQALELVGHANTQHEQISKRWETFIGFTYLLSHRLWPK